MQETDSIKDLAAASSNARHLVDRVNEAHYDTTIGEMVKTVQKLADVMSKILEREGEK